MEKPLIFGGDDDAVQAKIYGMLGKGVACCDHRSGLSVEVSDGATVTELLAQLGIPLEKIGMVSPDGRLAGKTAALQPGMMVKFFRPVLGG